MPQVLNFRKDSLIPMLVLVDDIEKLKFGFTLFQYKNSIGSASWFWQKMKNANALQFIDIVDESQNVETVALALVNAYKNPCTLNRLYAVLRSIFGDNSKLKITEKQGALDVDIVINSENTLFYRQWITRSGNSMQTKDGKSLVFIKTDKLGFFGDIKSFLKLFVLDGVSLENVSINTDALFLNKTNKKEGLWLKIKQRLAS